MDTVEKKGGFAKFIKDHVMYIVLVVLLLFFAIQNRTFISFANLRNILNQNSYVLVVGVGVGLVMLAGGLDLSVGYQISLNGVIIGMLLTRTGLPWGFAVAAALVIGCILSLVNGILFVRMKVFPFIITLATQYVYQGLSFILSDSVTITGLPDGFKQIGQGSIGPVPISIIIMVVVVSLGAFILNRTYFGHFYVQGLGCNPEAVSLAGISTDRAYLIIYGLAGVFIGLGTVMLCARTGSISSSMGPGTEFTIIAGAMLGGVRLGGGGGKMSNIVVGILILAVLSNGMQLMQLGNYPQFLAKGLVLIVAIGVDAHQSMSVLRRAEHVVGEPPDKRATADRSSDKLPKA